MTNTDTIIGDFYDAWRAQDLEWLASYLPNDFSHAIYVPREIYRDGGECQGKMQVIERWRSIVPQCEFLRFEIHTLLIHKNRAAAEISFRYRHRETGVTLDTTKANFWTFEAGWPVRLAEFYKMEGIEAMSRSLGVYGGGWREA